MLSFWKRLRADTRWVTKLLQLPDAEVREERVRQLSLLAEVTQLRPPVTHGRYDGHSRVSAEGRPWHLRR